MFVSQTQNAPYNTRRNDPRITRVGRFIRSTSIDELPQLFNVLLGDMSIVGPRPDLELQRNNYQPEEWQIRHIVRPGITGLAQVNGRSNISLQDRIEYDIKYVRTHDFWLDFKIILRTFAVVFFGRNTN
jgi:lipopolysaccharide/colanic/teichoic acid biosynthesis glycosyltransferase